MSVRMYSGRRPTGGRIVAIDAEGGVGPCPYADLTRGPEAARLECSELRRQRRRLPPHGSVSSADSSTGVLVRLPDGSGWAGSSPLGSREGGWPWMCGTERLTRLLARGLDRRLCSLVLEAVSAAVREAPGALGSPSAREAGRAAALAVLRREGRA